MRLRSLIGIAVFAAFALVAPPGSAQSAPEPSEPADAPASAEVKSEPAAAQPEPTRSGRAPMRSPGLFTAGIALLITGEVVKNVIGGYLLISEIFPEDKADKTKLTAGYVCVISGAAMTAVGITMAIIGGKREAPRAVLLPMLGPREAGLGLSLRF